MAYAALRRWAVVHGGRRFSSWPLCVASCGSVIWLAAQSPGPGAASGARSGRAWPVDGAGARQRPVVRRVRFDFRNGNAAACVLRGEPARGQAGTTVPALDTGAGDEVYPLTGSGKWVHDVIGIVVGTLALIGLLVWGLRGEPPEARHASGPLHSGNSASRTRAETTAGSAALPRGKARRACALDRGGGLYLRQVHRAPSRRQAVHRLELGGSRWPAGSGSRSLCPGRTFAGHAARPAGRDGCWLVTSWRLPAVCGLPIASVYPARKRPRGAATAFAVVRAGDRRAVGGDVYLGGNHAADTRGHGRGRRSRRR